MCSCHTLFFSSHTSLTVPSACHTHTLSRPPQVAPPPVSPLPHGATWPGDCWVSCLHVWRHMEPLFSLLIPPQLLHCPASLFLIDMVLPPRGAASLHPLLSRLLSLSARCSRFLPSPFAQVSSTLYSLGRDLFSLQLIDQLSIDSLQLDLRVQLVGAHSHLLTCAGLSPR